MTDTDSKKTFASIKERNEYILSQIRSGQSYASELSRELNLSRERLRQICVKLTGKGPSELFIFVKPTPQKVSGISRRGWHGDSAGHAKTGQIGGLVTARVHSRAFYQRIGRLGGRISPGNFRFSPERAKEAGRIGGRVKHQKGT